LTRPALRAFEKVGDGGGDGVQLRTKGFNHDIKTVLTNKKGLT